MNYESAVLAGTVAAIVALSRAIESLINKKKVNGIPTHSAVVLEKNSDTLERIERTQEKIFEAMSRISADHVRIVEALQRMERFERSTPPPIPALR